MREHDQEAYHADMLAALQHLEDVLVEAGFRPLTEDEIKEIRAALGITKPKREMEYGPYCF
jgi:hypothetical protein